MSSDHARARATLARIDFHSDLDILPLIDALSEHMCQTTGLDEESSHWLKVATREAVVNAIIHGNRNDRNKRVHLEFESVGDGSRAALSVRVRDEGSGFDPASVPDPSAAHNLLRPSGRGILLMRHLLDGLHFQRHPGGPTEVVLLKRAILSTGT